MFIFVSIILLICGFLLLCNTKKSKINNSQLEIQLEKIENLNEVELEEIFRKNLYLFDINYNKNLNITKFNYLSEDVKKFFLEFKEVKLLEENFLLSLDEEISYIIDIYDKRFLTIGYEGFDGHGYLLCNQKNVINSAYYEATDFSDIEEKSIYYCIITVLVLNNKLIL